VAQGLRHSSDFFAKPGILLPRQSRRPAARLGFLVTLLYYLIAWSAVGRDPARGVIMALYEAARESFSRLDALLDADGLRQ